MKYLKFFVPRCPLPQGIAKKMVVFIELVGSMRFMVQFVLIFVTQPQSSWFDGETTKNLATRRDVTLQRA